MLYHEKFTALLALFSMAICTRESLHSQRSLSGWEGSGNEYGGRKEMKRKTETFDL